MPNNEKKVSFRVTDEQLAEIERLKKHKYYSQSYSQLLRDIIDKGLEAVAKEQK